jgi:hypothetical protein
MKVTRAEQSYVPTDSAEPTLGLWPDTIYRLKVSVEKFLSCLLFVCMNIKYVHFMCLHSSAMYGYGLNTWTVVQLTAANFKPFIFCAGLRLVQCNEHFHFHDYGRLLLAFCIILLCTRKRTEFGKSHVYRRPMCVLENCQWCSFNRWICAAKSQAGEA